MAVAAVVLVSLGAVLGVVLSRQREPPSFAETTTAGMFDIVPTITDDPRSVFIDIDAQALPGLLAPRAGVVTQLACEPGGTMRSGEVVLAIDGVPLPALASAMPLWRDISLGMEGTDVAAIQSELVRLGLSTSTSGRYDDETSAAVRALLARSGAPTPAEGLERGAVVWLPRPSVTVASCAATVGSTLVAGGPLVSLAPSIDRARVALPVDAAEGERVLEVDGQRFAVDGEGAVSDDAFPALAAALAVAPEEQAGSVAATLRLADPIEGWGVPASSLSEFDGVMACVSDGVGGHRVRVIGSELGTTSVVFEGAAPPAVSLRPPEGLACE